MDRNRFYEIDNLTINLTLQCNMRCAYCYVFSQEVPNHMRKLDLSLEDIEKILINYAEAKKEVNGYKILDVSWHGGEPLYRGINFFQELMKLEEKLYNEKKIIVRNRLQTNGTLINEQWADFFYKYKFSIGISFDGPEHIYSASRYYKGKKSSYKDTLRGINILKDKGVPLGILSVIKDCDVDYYEEIYYFFKELNVDSVEFIPCFLPEGDKSVNITPEKWGRFLVNIYDIWIKDLSYEIVYLSHIINKINLLKEGKDCRSCGFLCELSDECGNNLSVTTDGELYFCECLLGLKEYRVGNIIKEPIYELLNSDKILNRKEEINVYDDSCFKCNIHKICEGGCLKHRIREDIPLNESKDRFCVSKKMIINHILKDLFSQG